MAHIRTEDSSGGSAVIRASGLTKRYGSKLAVDRLDLTVKAGEVFGFLGPNGAGKSTTIRLLLGLVRPTSGDVHLFGEPVRPGAPVLRRAGAAIERPAFYPHLGGAANLRVFATLRAHGTGGEIADALVAAGLDPASRVPVRRYSTGMKQRLALALALMGRPALVILDEPTDGLDPAGIVDIRRTIGDLAAAGTTVFLSSHLLTEVERVCTRIAIIVNGRIVREGDPADLVGTTQAILLTFGDPARAAAAAAILAAEALPARPGKQGTQVIVDAELSEAGRIIRLLDGHGVSIAQITSLSPTLEDIFMDLAGSEPADGNRRATGAP